MSVADWTFEILRAEDLLSLRVSALNLSLETGTTPPRLVRSDRNAPSFLSIELAPQHIAERFFVQTSGAEEALASPPVVSVLAGSSRLVFRLPDAWDGLDFTLDSVLDWNRLEPFLAKNALPLETADSTTRGPEIQSPWRSDRTPVATAIELPYRLWLSPVASRQGTPAWSHQSQIARRDGRVELWHTRLARKNSDGIHERAGDYPLRAIWYVGLMCDPNSGRRPRTNEEGSNNSSSIEALTGSLAVRVRDAVAHLSGNFGLPLRGSRFYVPKALTAERLTLSALGAWMHARGEWKKPDDIDGLNPIRSCPGGPQEVWTVVAESERLALSEWHHTTAMGRDQRVRTVVDGFLDPFGHRATFVVVTEREFRPSPAGDPVAYLVQYAHLDVHEKRIDYADRAGAYPHESREMPLRSVSIEPLPVRSADNREFLCQVTALDWEEQRVEFVAPLRLISAAQPDVGGSGERTFELAGQLVALAKNDVDSGSVAQGTTVSVKRLVVNMAAADLGPERAPFVPVFSRAEVTIPAVDYMVAAGRDDGYAIELHDQYLTNGFRAPNIGQVFAKLTDRDLDLAFPVERSGGLVRPRMKINGLSRTVGPVPTVDEIGTGTFDPRHVFDALNDATLLGVIKLSDVIQVATGNELSSEKVPRLVHTRHPDRVETSFTWRPAIRRVNDPSGGGTSNPLLPFMTTRDTALEIESRMWRSNDGRSGSSVTGSLRNFAFTYPSAPGSPKIACVIFDRVDFQVRDREQPTLTVHGVHVEFLGALAFFQELAQLLPPNGFGAGAALRVTPEEVVAGYTLAIPTAGVGAFSLEHIAVSAQLSLPLLSNRDTTLRLAFSDRMQPFLTSLSLLGGGGFLAVRINTSGIETVEGALEIGGNITVGLGIIEANVHAMMGLYFGIRTDGGVTLAFGAYYRIGGSVDLLGIIGISIEIYLQMTFIPRKAPGVLGFIEGRGSITVGVHLLFVEKSVTLTLERSFAVPTRADVPLIGSVAVPFLDDPPFDAMISPTDWEEYCRAFA